MTQNDNFSASHAFCTVSHSSSNVLHHCSSCNTAFSHHEAHSHAALFLLMTWGQDPPYLNLLGNAVWLWVRTEHV